MSLGGVLERIELDESILDDALPCTVDGCENAAEWRFACRQCDNGDYACPVHKVDMEAFFTKRQAEGKGIVCRRCHAAVDSKHPWRDLVEFRPI